MSPTSLLPIRSAPDLGLALRQARLDEGLRATHVANKSGRSRDLLHRLESGRDVTTGALLDILQAMGYAIRLEKVGLPTLEEMRQRFGDDEEG